MENKNSKIAVIIGAGPSGLACAYELINKKSNIIPIIIEKLPCVGGLSRTVYKNNMGVDIGGHRLYTDDEYVKSIWFKFLTVQNSKAIDDIICSREIDYPIEGKNPNEFDDVMLIRNRFSSIIYNNQFFPYPLKINFQTLKKLGFLKSLKAGVSYFKSVFIKRDEKNLEDFMINRFGRVLYETFFKDYTKKVWGVDAKLLSCEWGNERIRKLSLFKTVLNSILSNIKFLKFKKETSLIDKFYYPKFGCSQLWNLMAEYINNNGGKILLNCEFLDFEVEDEKIKAIKYKDEKGNINNISGDFYISSAPIKEIVSGLRIPVEIKNSAKNLPYRDYILVSFYSDKLNLKNYTDYKTINNATPDNWLYLQENGAIAARIQIMNNWSPYLVEDFKNKYLVSLEYFVNENDDFWKKTDDEIIKLATFECEKYNLFSLKNIIKSFVIKEKKAYPAYFGEYKRINEIKNALKKYNNLYLIGRNGQHKYNNMDEAMVCGINMARELF